MKILKVHMRYTAKRTSVLGHLLNAAFSFLTGRDPTDDNIPGIGYVQKHCYPLPCGKDFTMRR